MTQKTESALQKTATPSAARRRRNARAAATPSPPNQIKGGGGESPPQGNPIKGRKGGKASPNEYAPFATIPFSYSLFST